MDVRRQGDITTTQQYLQGCFQTSPITSASEIAIEIEEAADPNTKEPDAPPAKRMQRVVEKDERLDEDGLSAKDRSVLASTKGQFNAYFVLFIPPDDLPPPKDAKQAAMGLVDAENVTAAFIHAAAPAGLSVKHFGGRGAVRAVRTT